MSDLISRQAAKNKKVYSEERHEYVIPVAEIDWLPSAQPYTEEEIQAMQDLEQAQFDKAYQIGVEEGLQSAQPEQSDTSEFWRKRADYYSDMCLKLVGEMGEGVKIASVKISENGIEFIKEQPSAQPEHTETHSCDYQRTETHGWIPVSEALPKDGVTVWVTIRGHDVIRREEGETLEQAIARIGKIRWVTQGYWSAEEHGWNDPSFGCPLMVQPVAWMPIDTPEPWKGGKKDVSKTG